MSADLFILIFGIPLYAVFFGRLVPDSLRLYLFITLWLVMVLSAVILAVYLSN